MANGILTLSNGIHFEPVSKSKDVFFDNVNKKIFTAWINGGAINVTARGPNETDILRFRLAEKGNIYSIKLSPDLKIVATQRSPTTVEFCNINSEVYDSIEYAQSCRGKNIRIIGIEWTGNREILFLTDGGLELYQVIPEKRFVRSVRVQNLSINWYVYSPDAQIVVASCSSLGTLLQPFLIQPGNILRLAKFDVDLCLNVQPSRLALLDRDVAITRLNGVVYVVVLRHKPKNSSSAEILLYRLNTESSSPVVNTHVIRLGSQGKFAIHFVDDLIIIHQQEKKTSVVFDLKMASSTGKECCVEIDEPMFGPSALMTSVTLEQIEIYSPNWVLFQPNVVIDAQIGCMWFVEINLDGCANNFMDLVSFIKFLLNRADAKPLIFKYLVNNLKNQQINSEDFGKICTLFNDAAVQSHDSKNIISQSEMYSFVFYPLAETEKCEPRWMCKILLEYLLACEKYSFPHQLFLQEILVANLVKSCQFDTLRQLICTNVVHGSKPMAFLLLSLENQYPPALQLAMDMLSKRNASVEEIVEVLLSKQKVIESLRYLQSFGALDRVSPLKIVEAAWLTQDCNVFYTAFSYYEQYALKKSGTCHFARGEQYDQYLAEYQKLIGKPELITT